MSHTGSMGLNTFLTDFSTSFMRKFVEIWFDFMEDVDLGSSFDPKWFNWLEKQIFVIFERGGKHSDESKEFSLDQFCLLTVRFLEKTQRFVFLCENWKSWKNVWFRFIEIRDQIVSVIFLVSIVEICESCCTSMRWKHRFELPTFNILIR